MRTRSGPWSDWPSAGGEMAALIRARDWAATPLGPVGDWPQSLRTALDMVLAMPGPATILWGPAHVQLYNDAYVAIARERHPALLGRPVAEGWPDAFERVLAPLLDAAYAGRATQIASLPVTLSGPDGRPEKRVFHTNWSPIRDASGAVAGVLETLVEVTGHHRAEAALCETEARLSLVVQSLPIGVGLRSADGTLVLANQELRRFLPDGLMPSRDAATGARWQAWHPDGRPVAPEDFPGARAMRGESVLPGIEMLYAPADGAETVWTNVVAVPVRDRDGHIAGHVTVISDIDASKRAAEALRGSEARLRTLVEGIPQLVWRAGDGGAWTWASPQWAAYTGQPEPASHGMGWLAAIHPGDRAALLAGWREAGASGAIRADHRLFHAGEGRYRWVQARATPVRDEAGRIVERLGTTTDVEDLRRAHEQALFIAELQHRGRNLLTVVGGIAGQLLAAYPQMEEFGARFDQRLAAIGRAQGLLSRESTPNVTMETLVRLELAAHGADGNGRVRLEGRDTALPARAVQMLALALHELLTNALKHGALAAPGGRLAIAWGERQDADRRLWLDWQETGVTPANGADRRRGFGLDLIEDMLPYELKAETQVEFGHDGLRCSIVLPCL